MGVQIRWNSVSFCHVGLYVRARLVAEEANVAGSHLQCSVVAFLTAGIDFRIERELAFKPWFHVKVKIF